MSEENTAVSQQAPQSPAGQPSAAKTMAGIANIRSAERADPQEKKRASRSEWIDSVKSEVKYTVDEDDSESTDTSETASEQGNTEDDSSTVGESDKASDAAEGGEASAESAIEESDTSDAEQHDDRSERSRVRQAWAQLQRSQARLRAKEEHLKQFSHDYQRLQNLERQLRENPYSVVEQLGGSLNDWQQRVLSSDRDPRIDDVRKVIEERDRQWQQRFDALEHERVSREQETYERNFVSALESSVDELPHCRALGRAAATDMAHDFAEYVARAMAGRGGIPKSEQRAIERYVSETPRSLLLDPKRIAKFIDSRLSDQAKALGVKITSEPEQQERQKKEPAQQKRHQQLDNRAAGTRANPAPTKMSRAEWIKSVASSVRPIEDDED